MKVKFFWAFVISLGLLSGHLQAQVPPQTAHIGEGQVLRGRFEQQRHLTGFSAPVKSYGSFVLKPGKGLIWDTQKPFAVTTVLSPAGLAQEVRGRESIRMSSSKLPFMSKLYSMLSGALVGNWQEMQSAFNITQSTQGKRWHLKLVPLRQNDPAMPIKEIVARGGRLLDEVQIIKLNGDKDVLIFSSQKLDTIPISENEKMLFDNLGR